MQPVTHLKDIDVGWVACWKGGISVGLKYSDDNSDRILVAQNRTGVQHMNQTEKQNNPTLPRDR